ncbi:hypothetical protein PMG71_03240 [Roseofilum sp. BLCC_M154]|uniref:Uncharacterized protein n=1 Tax=Roseofilum acuticapitatum BLCC-M154 TaxID=3022444 RepID=A0ABT7ANG6_9CYAN|nr:hypothetical protein [Roseofilum acuticapitatum]MDJ1168437.1 hypothetical protein [Roseofilum acuticapitatum BLCC-M154]
MNFAQFCRNLGEAKVYYPQVAAATGGVVGSILAWHIVQKLGDRSPEWIRLNQKEIATQTALTEAEQQLARQQLAQKGLLEERRVPGKPGVVDVRLNLEQLEVALQGGGSPRSVPAVDRYFPVKRQAIATAVTPHYQFTGPWNSPEQFEEFQSQLLEYAKQKGLDNPSGWMFKIVDGLTKGIISPFWDEFTQNIPLGSSQQVKRDWEIETGVPYPAFEEERIQYYVQKGEPLEVAVSRARADLRKPVLAKDLWEGFLRKCDRLADEALKAKKKGLTTPYLPPSFSQRPEITKEQVMEKLLQVSTPIALPESQPDPEPEATPSLEQLQKAYQSPLGRSWVKQQLQQHPEWGYEIIDNQVQPSLPF